MSVIIQGTNLVKRYNQNDQVLNNVSVSIESDTFVTIVGPSGSGKSTFMDLI